MTISDNGSVHYVEIGVPITRKNGEYFTMSNTGKLYLWNLILSCIRFWCKTKERLLDPAIPCCPLHRIAGALFYLLVVFSMKLPIWSIEAKGAGVVLAFLLGLQPHFFKCRTIPIHSYIAAPINQDKGWKWFTLHFLAMVNDGEPGF